MIDRIMEAAAAIYAIETQKGVRVVARGGAYGASRLVLIDTHTGEEVSLDEATEAAGKAGYDVSTYEG
jgi:hypothetical protein